MLLHVFPELVDFFEERRERLPPLPQLLSHLLEVFIGLYIHPKPATRTQTDMQTEGRKREGQDEEKLSAPQPRPSALSTKKVGPKGEGREEEERG